MLSLSNKTQRICKVLILVFIVSFLSIFFFVEQRFLNTSTRLGDFYYNDAGEIKGDVILLSIDDKS